MKKVILLTIIMMHLFINIVLGQKIDPNTSLSQVAIKVSYFGEFVLHPGLAAGIDYTIYERQQWLDVHWDSELGVYYHKWNNNALFLQTSIGSRFVTSSSAFVDVNLGIGYMLCSPNGDFYSVNTSGDLSTKGRPFTSHMKPNISLLFGWDGARKKDIPLILQAGIEAYGQSHFNNSILPHAALRLGVIYKLKK